MKRYGGTLKGGPKSVRDPRSSSSGSLSHRLPMDPRSVKG